MGIAHFQKLVQEYNEVARSIEAKKPEPKLYSIDGASGNLGVAAYYPIENIIRISIGSAEVKIPGSAVYSLKSMFDDLPGD